MISGTTRRVRIQEYLEYIELNLEAHFSLPAFIVLFLPLNWELLDVAVSVHEESNSSKRGHCKIHDDSKREREGLGEDEVHGCERQRQPASQGEGQQKLGAPRNHRGSNHHVNALHPTAK